MKYSVLAVDIDGTLEHAGTHPISQVTVDSLNRLQQDGVTVIVATGRGPSFALPELLGGFIPDYFVTANGACVFDKRRNIIHEQKLTEPQINTLIEMAQSNGFRLCFSFDDAYYFYTGYEDFVAQMRKTNRKIRDYMLDGSKKIRHKINLPYGAHATFSADEGSIFSRIPHDFKIMQSSRYSYDICSPGVDKSMALTMLANKIGVGWANIVAIGDSENDLDMIKAAGVGVAMGNAPQHIKNAADFTTGSVEEHGVAAAIKQLFY